MSKKISLETVLYYILIGLLVYMPLHLFLVCLLSKYIGHFSLLDGVKDVVTLIGLGVSVIVAWKQKLYANKDLMVLSGLALTYGLLHLSYLFFIGDRLDHHALLVATLFNGRIFAYLLMGMVVASTHRINWRTTLKLVIIVSTATCLFGFLQYLGPKDLMTHFGYSLSKGVLPAFYIDGKPDFPRIMATVRDPNSYGAYLILPLTILFVFIIRREARLRKLLPLFVIHLLAIYLTFSRGAWIGAIIAICFASVYILRKHLIHLTKKYAYVIVVLAMIAGASVYAARDSYVVQNVFLHKDQNTVMTDPNQLRVELQSQAIKKIASDPEGHGPGTAGIVSIGNKKTKTVLTENYFLQIAYEVGIFGLVLYIAVLLYVLRLLLKSQNADHKIILISTFWAYMVISLLIHLWSNEAVAAEWWILAGLVIATQQKSAHKAALR